MTEDVRNAGVFVSVCFHEAPPTEAGTDLIRRTASLIAGAYRYWEVILVAPDGAEEAERFRRLSQETPNVRVLKARGSPSVYRRRAIAASEAIGDVVVLSAAHEVEDLDLLALLREAIETESAIFLSRTGRSLTSPLFETIGAASGFRVSLEDLQTCAFPRTLLNRLLSHPERELALRFPPRNESFPVRRLPLPSSREVSRGTPNTWRRIALLYRLLVNAAPRVLAGVAILSLLVLLLALFYAAYAVVVWMVLPDVAPGWLTTSAMQSLIAMFLGTALLGISLGLQKVLERLEPSLDDLVVDEYSTVDLFAQMTDLNVDVALGPQALPVQQASGPPRS